MLRKLVQRTFDIRSGELGVSLLMQLYIFLIITTLLIVKPTVNALFLSELTSQSLPYAFLLVALVAMGSSYFYNKALKRFSLLRIITFTLIISALVFISLKVLLSLHYFSTWLLYFYYVWVAIYAVLATSQFWILANLVYNIREAKRLFGFIGAGAISGGILGGYLTNLLAPIIGNDDLMIIGAILVIGCIPLLHIIWRKRVKSLGVFRQQQRTYASNESSFKLILESKHLTYIAGIIGVGVLVAKLVDYQYSDMASKAIPDSDELASFFGFWFSTFNASSLVIQLFLTRKIVGVWGTASTLLVLPLGIGVLQGLVGELVSDRAAVNAFQLNEPDQCDITLGIDRHVGGIGTTMPEGTIPFGVDCKSQAVVVGNRIAGLFAADFSHRFFRKISLTIGDCVIEQHLTETRQVRPC